MIPRILRNILSISFLCALLLLVGCTDEELSSVEPTPTLEPSPTPRYTEATKAMLALNYCHLSLVKILAYEDRIILHEEYDNIINNINLAMIDDEEIITVLKHLMDTLTEFKLAETEKELFVNAYNKKVSTAFYEALANSATSTVAIQSLKEIVNSTQASPDETLTMRVMQGAHGGAPGGIPGIVVGTVTSFVSKASQNPISAGIAGVVSVAVVGDIWQSYHTNLAEYRRELRGCFKSFVLFKMMLKKVESKKTNAKIFAPNGLVFLSYQGHKANHSRSGVPYAFHLPKRSTRLDPDGRLLSQPFQHQSDHNGIEHGFTGFDELFIILAQASRTPKPAKCPLNYPPSG